MTLQGLEAHRALPAVALLLDQLQAALGAVRQEAGADLAAVDADLGVLVLGVADRQADLVERAKVDVLFAAQVVAGLLQVDRDGTFRIRIDRGQDLLVGHAVGRIDLLDRDPEEAAVVHVRDAGAVGVDLDVGVLDLLVGIDGQAFGLGQARGDRRARDVVVAARAVIDVDGEHQRTLAELGRAVDRLAVVHRRDRARQAAFEAIGRRRRGHAVVDDIDHPADARAAIGQGRGAAQHFHSRGLARIGGHRVVGRQRRGVDLADAVLQHHHARTRQAADHRTAGAGAVEGRAQARLAVQHVAQAGGRQDVQLVAGDDVDAAGHRIQRHRVGRGGDDDLVDLIGRLVGFRGRGRGGRGRRVGMGGNGGGERDEARGREGDATEHGRSWKRLKLGRGSGRDEVL